MKIDLKALAQILRDDGHEYLGITPDPPDPPHSPPAAMITPERTIHAFSYALQSAIDLWPEATQYAIISGNALLQRMSGSHYPPGFRRIEDPATVLHFEAGPAGEGEDNAAQPPDRAA